MGRGNLSKLAIDQDRAAQRIAQGIRAYLMSILVAGNTNAEGVYSAHTIDQKSVIDFAFAVSEGKAPFRSVSFHMEFVHGPGDPT